MRLKPFSEIISYKQFKGFSSYFSIGKTKGWQVKKDGPSLRFDLGRFSFSLMSIDIQNLIKGLLEELREKDVKEKQVNELGDKFKEQLDAVNKREAEIECQQKEFTLLKEKANGFSANIDELKKQVKEYESKIDDLNAEMDDTLADNDIYKEEIEDLKENKEKLEKELQETKEIYNEQIEENKRLMALLIESSSESSSSSENLSSSSSADILSSSSSLLI